MVIDFTRKSSRDFGGVWRRKAEGFFEEVYVGKGIDIGHGGDAIWLRVVNFGIGSKGMRRGLKAWLTRVFDWVL